MTWEVVKLTNPKGVSTGRMLSQLRSPHCPAIRHWVSFHNFPKRFLTLGQRCKHLRAKQKADRLHGEPISRMGE